MTKSKICSITYYYFIFYYLEHKGEKIKKISLSSCTGLNNIKDFIEVLINFIME